MTETTTGRLDDGAGDRRRVAVAAWQYDGRAEGTIPAARTAAARFLHRAAAAVSPWPPTAHDAALLVVSELVTNAVVHAPGPLVLELVLRAGGLDISVYDTRPATPVARPHDPERIGGHGMEIVAALCDRVETEPTPHGKRVRARLPLD
ncbi:ATP-binding protein [Streptomyces sp. NPDC085481]|uniref:ATP-binding protein n=1 Tax=Streptomyces sp. NPDC085481 TaxID=3365727 RepID=UPI0037CFEE67